ncbi:MAG TPA: glycosyltransferase family 4 protein [Aequorivita sp.]|nr:glycosyltransferase family 4 protein [Aequorivita sp.]
MKKILFTSLNDHVSWGGSEELWSKSAIHLSKKNQVTVLVKKWDPEPKAIQVLKKEGIDIVYKQIPQRRKRSLFFKILRKIGINTFNGKNEFSQLQQPFNNDLAILSVGNSLDPKIISYTDYFKLHNIPYVLVIQLATDLRNVADNLLSKLSVAYGSAKKVCFLSKDNLEKTQMNLSSIFKNSIYINNPFNYKQKYLAPNSNSSYTIACVAAFTTFHKGQDLLISVFAQEKWKKRNLILNLYGDGNNKEQIKNLITLHGLQGKVNIIGFESDKDKIWKKNLACIMPSRMEGQSLAMLEAMSCGRLIISTRVGDAEQLIDEGITGFLIDAATTKLIDLSLERAWQRKDDWIEMGLKSRAHLYNIITKDPVVDFSEKLINLLK